MSESFVTVYEFRKKLEQYLLHSERPMVISHRGMPMGYFIPARIWHDRETVAIFNELVAATLEMSGYGEQDVKDAIESFAHANADAVRERLLRHLDRIDPAAGKYKASNGSKR
ncbi:hypothetical protein [Luteimonas sp. R10]|uniref:hypothetical protein n=1 Tax=Luteimonas sp. R10 TaxID=3108176 RepID=UPI00308F5152|nr:hypothetical protein U3649_14610 [Luteimonas sp. R10]